MQADNTPVNHFIQLDLIWHMDLICSPYILGTYQDDFASLHVDVAFVDDSQGLDLIVIFYLLDTRYIDGYIIRVILIRDIHIQYHLIHKHDMTVIFVLWHQAKFLQSLKYFLFGINNSNI